MKIMLPSRQRAFPVISYYFLGTLSEFIHINRRNQLFKSQKHFDRTNAYPHSSPEENFFCCIKKNTFEWMMKLCLTSGNKRQIILCPIEGLNSAFLVGVSGRPVTGNRFRSVFPPSRACSSSIFLL